MDTSVHPWLEERSTEEIVLIAMADDASSRLSARFVRRDTGRVNYTHPPVDRTHLLEDRGKLVLHGVVFG